MVGFFWAVSSRANYDKLTFAVDGQVVKTISGEVEWTEVTHEIATEGTHTLRWTYQKSTVGGQGSDCGWLDKFTFGPTIEVTFDPGQYGTLPASERTKRYVIGSAFANLPVPTSAVKDFLGWYDGAKFVRALDTGSSTVYALEYKRLDGKTVTCVWCVRGTFDFDFDGKAELVSLYGGKGEKKGSGRMTYVVTDKPLAGFKVSNRAFPFEDGLFKDAPVVCDLAGAKYTVEPDPGVASTTHSFMPQLKPGTFEVKAAKDAAKGDCLEVTLKSDPKKTTSFWTEYTTIRFAEPVAIPGEPSLLAVETMGNSNWGQIRFEIEDANGEVFRNLSTGSWWICGRRGVQERLDGRGLGLRHHGLAGTPCGRV